MDDVYLVKPDYLMKLGGINKNVDMELVLPAIIAVQDIYIQQILGTPLYNDLKTKIIADESLASNPNEKALLKDYIAKALVWYLKMEISSDLSVRYMNKGVVSVQSEGSQQVDSAVLKTSIDSNRSKAERYSQLLTEYLVANSVTFPKYYEGSTTGMIPVVKNYTNGIYLRDSF